MPNLGILALDGAGCEGVVGFGLAQRWLVGGSLLELLVYRVAQRLPIVGVWGVRRVNIDLLVGSVCGFARGW